MKLNGLLGTGTGKLGSSVFAVAAGTQIVREYVAQVANPSTPAQVNQRAKMKLMTQISAALANVIVIPKEGLVSSRNKFVSSNFSSVSATSGVATVNLPQLQITAGSVAIPQISCERDGNGHISVELTSQAPIAVNRLVVAAFEVANGNTLSMLDSIVVEDAGENRTFPTLIANSDRDVVIYAYGVMDLDAAATANYANYEVVSGQDLARLVADRTISLDDYRMTKTVGDMLVRETSADFTSITVGGVNIAASGTTQVPYADTKQVVLQAEDVDDLWYAVTGSQVPMQFGQFVNGQGTVTVSQLGGGEDLRFYIGVYDGSDFTVYKTYGGIAHVAAQGATFTSVNLGGVVIANDGDTPVGVASSLALSVSASNVQNLMLRVKKGNTILESTAFVSGVVNTSLTGLSIGDVVTFEIGHIINDAWVVVATYGGSAIIAQNPPVFSALYVDSSTINPSGQTQIQSGNGLTVEARGTNADGKYLLKKVGSAAFASTGAQFASGVANTTIDLADGDNVQFAIGTVSGGTAVAEVTFGGTVVGVDTPQAGITMVSINGSNLTEDLYNQQEGSKAISFVTTGIEDNSMVAAMINSRKQPGQTIEVTAGTYQSVVNNAAQFTASTLADENYSFVVGTLSGSTLTVSYLYPYRIFMRTID